MTNKDPKKNIALHPETYGRLSTLAAQMRIDNGGKFVSMSEAVDRLLDYWGLGDGWNDSKRSLPNIGDKLLVEFPSGEIHRSIYFEHDGFSVYLEAGLGVAKNGFYPFSSSTCKRWKLNNFEFPENETNESSTRNSVDNS